VLEYILTGAIACPIGENFAIASLKNKLCALSLEQIDEWEHPLLDVFYKSPLQLLLKIS
jgi:hypothetical protein